MCKIQVGTLPQSCGDPVFGTSEYGLDPQRLWRATSKWCVKMEGMYGTDSPGQQTRLHDHKGENWKMVIDT